MKLTFSLYFLLLTSPVFSQKTDSLLVAAEVGNLISEAENLLKDKKYLEALSPAEAALQSCMELGDAHPFYAKSCRLLGTALAGTGKFIEGEKRLTEARDLTAKNEGTESAAYADCLNALGVCWTEMEKYKPAEQALLDCLALREKTGGKNTPAYASALLQAGFMYSISGKKDKAAPLFEQAKQIREATAGKASREYAFALARVADNYNDFERYDEAEALLLEAKALQEKLLGTAHPDYVATLISLANTERGLGRLKAAESLYLQGVSIATTSLGATNPLTLRYRLNLAQHYIVEGLYEQAEALLLETLEVRKTNDTEDFGWSRINNLLGRLYRDQGQFDKAEPLLVGSLRDIERLRGKDNLTYSNALNTLGIFYRRTKQYDKAEAAYEEVRVFREKFFGKEHVQYAHIMENLGVVFQNTGRYELAETYMLTSKAIKQKAYEAGKPADYQNALLNLASLYTETGKLEKSLEIDREALQVTEKLYGRFHPLTAHCLQGLGSDYEYGGQFEEAKKWYLDAFSVRDSLLSDHDPDFISTQLALADCEMDLGNKDSAQTWLRQARQNIRSLVFQNGRYQSASEFHQFIEDYRREDLDKTTSMALALQADFPEWAGTAADDALFYKGFILEKKLRLEKAASQAPEAVRQIYTDWKRLQRKIGEAPADAAAETPGNLVAEAEQLEKQLIRQLSGFEAAGETGWREVQAALQPGEAAVEFVHFFVDDISDSTYYAALVMRPGQAQPAFLRLCEARPLEALLTQGSQSGIAHKGKLYSGSALYDLIWKPLETALNGVKTIYFSPSGWLHRVNFGAISVGKNQMLADRYQLVMMGSTRQLAQDSESDEPNDRLTAAIFGGVVYESDSLAVPAENAGLENASLNYYFAENANRSLLGDHWQYLPHTEKEASEAAALLTAEGYQVDYRKGVAASEEAFKSMSKGHDSPKVIHVATHGFFFPEDAALKAKGLFQPVFVRTELPLMRSGLILAGANHAWQTGRAWQGREDGILTAYEISQLNLSGTELVLLSACETGLGDLAGNEGVFGLQRAFKIAGVKNLLMSLWQLPDKQAQEFVSLFYQYWLKSKLPIRTAFRKTQKIMSGQYPSPYYWAGFVLME
jgi:CHAT domain-containing protein